MFLPDPLVQVGAGALLSQRLGSEVSVLTRGRAEEDSAYRALYS